MSDNTHPRIEVTATGVTIEKDPHTAPIHIPDSVLAANSAMVRHYGPVNGAAQLTLTLLARSFSIESTPRMFWETSEQPRLFTFQEVCDHLAKRVASTITNPDGTALDQFQIASWVDDLTAGIAVDFHSDANRELAMARASALANLDRLNAELGTDTTTTDSEANQ